MMPLIYDELHKLAEQCLRFERPDHTLQPTALVNEAYLKLVQQHNISWQNRAQLFAIAAQLMRRILIDYARAHGAVKRGGRCRTLSLDEAIGQAESKEVDLILLDDALVSLAALDAQQSQIVELRFFGGLSIEETAEVLGVSPTTVKRDWAMARAWLCRELGRAE